MSAANTSIVIAQKNNFLFEVNLSAHNSNNLSFNRLPQTIYIYTRPKKWLIVSIVLQVRHRLFSTRPILNSTCLVGYIDCNIFHCNISNFVWDVTCLAKHQFSSLNVLPSIHIFVAYNAWRRIQLFKDTRNCSGFIEHKGSLFKYTLQSFSCHILSTFSKNCSC